MASSIPGAVSYFFNLAKNAFPVSGYDVRFTKDLPVYTAQTLLMITGVTDITHEWAELGMNYKVEEHYKIQCQLVTYAGDLNYIQRMTDCFAALDILTVALAQDYTLGQNVRLCLPVVEGEFMPGQDPKGYTLGSLMWFIHCEARIATLT